MKRSESPRKIGVIGGMGPAATVLFMACVIERTEATDDADHVPMIVDNNTQVPSRIKALIEKSGEDPGSVLAEMARGLEAAGAQALAMPCNTAHNYAPAIRQAVAIPMLDMVELTVERIAAMPLAVRYVGIMGSPALRLTGIYDRALSARGISTVYPADDATMLAAIRAIKVSSAAPQARETLARAAQELAAAGADVLLVACSEFSILADAILADLTVVDSLNVLAAAVVDFAFGEARTAGEGARQTA
jgi:aspartate racemase